MARRNVTITLEAEVARWARVTAAERDMSVARFVGELLRERMLADRAYEASMDRFLSWRPRPLKNAGDGYPARDELHERRDLR